MTTRTLRIRCVSDWWTTKSRQGTTVPCMSAPERLNGETVATIADGARSFDVSSGEPFRVDASATTYLDSEGIAGLIGINRSLLQRGGGGLRIVRPSPIVFELLQLTRLSKILLDDQSSMPAAAPRSTPTTVSTPLPLECRVPARRAFIPRLVDLARTHFVDVLGLPADVADRYEIGVAEAVTNAVVHGGRGRAGALVGMRISASTSLRVEVSDDGEGFSPDAVPDPTERPLEEGGRGLFIMRTMFDQVSYGPTRPGRNVLVLETKLEPSR